MKHTSENITRIILYSYTLDIQSNDRTTATNEKHSSAGPLWKLFDLSSEKFKDGSSGDLFDHKKIRIIF